MTGQNPQEVQHLTDPDPALGETMCGLHLADLPEPSPRWPFCKECRTAGRERTGAEPLIGPPPEQRDPALTKRGADLPPVTRRTGLEHYRRAEDWVHRAEHESAGSDLRRDALALAQVHATLAQTAAAVLASAALYQGDDPAVSEWSRIAGFNEVPGA